MPNVKQEVEELEKVAAEHSGARVRLADLQLHTPRDKRFKAGTPLTKPYERKKFAEANIEAAVDRGLDVIAITEHNHVSWLAELAAAAEQAGLVFFPGLVGSWSKTATARRVGLSRVSGSS